MLFKQVKEYSNRQRIDINKSDGLKPGAELVLLTDNEYNTLKQDILKLTDSLTAKDKELELMKNQEQNLQQIIKDITTPIYENHKIEIEKKDKQIKQLQVQLDLLKNKTNQYNLDMQGLNVIEIAILKKHKNLIKNFNENIAVLGVDQDAIDTDAKAISGLDENLQE